MKSIYTYYKQRLVEISGKNRSLFSRKITKKNSFDLGKLFDGDYDAISNLVDFLWNKSEDSFNILSKEPNPRLFKNLGLEQKFAREVESVEELEGNVKANSKARLERRKKEEFKKVVISQVNSIKLLKREIEEFEKETGRYELYVGYPFVQGYIGKDFEVKAPLVLFPVNIDIVDETTVNIELRQNEDIQLNRVLMIAYAQQNKVKNFEELEMSIKGSLTSKFKTIQNLTEYLRKFGIKISYSQRKGLFDYERTKDVPKGHGLEIKHLCVLGRYPLANAIYNDYELLEKRKLTNDAIDELLYAKQIKQSNKTDSHLFTIGSLDYAQENAVHSLNKNGNMVIYGPPGTGKSQTIVNIIADAIAKKKRVLVVSQKRAALDVVYNRLGLLNSKVMYLVDSEKNKNYFYERVKSTHEEIMKHKGSSSIGDFHNVQEKLEYEEQQLKNISDVLFSKTEFGLSLSQMYANSSLIGRKSYDYTIYQNMLENSKLMALNYQRLNDSLRLIKEKNKAELYYKYVEEKKSNPFIGNIKNNLEFHTVNSTKSKLEKLLQGRVAPFDMSKYPNSRQLVAYFVDKKLKMKSIKPLVSFVAKTKHPKVYKALYASIIFFPALPFTIFNKYKIKKQISNEFKQTLEAVTEYIEDYEFLQEVLTENGYSMMLNNILNGNTLHLKLLLKTLDNYVEFRDLTNILDELSEDERIVLKFAYKTTDTKAKYLETLSKIKTVRIYHEITVQEDLHKAELSKILDYDNIKTRIISLKNEQNALSRDICAEQFIDDYKKYFEKNKDSKNYLYQITKTQNQWSIRKFMEVYGEYLYTLFPCWLLSPEGVCTILPLVKNLFDIILFDEASQVFIENTLPVIYRGKNIVVAGDTKQLRPTAIFVKRFLGGDFDDKLDYSTQAALEVESLLDLAITRYKSANLTYHYRSKNEELINFSNQSFYEGKLQVSPNTSKNKGLKPIERILVKGKWIDRCNLEEVKAVVDILKKLSVTRKNNQSIGIITFNSEQEAAIEDAIDQEANVNPKFRDWILKEQNRKENGEDISLFVKNLENVQGDERDIIIFSIGYARNETGRVVANFGPLSLDGGENRLNVAITRAKEKIYVVTSIEPEELNVESSKNAGPKIFKNYLKYVRAVSNNRELETKIILEQANTQPEIITKKENLSGIEEELKLELEKLGYKVETKLGNTDYKISVAIYDKTYDKFLLGLECDYAAFESSPSVLERDVFRPSFLKSRGWNIIRIWSRDYWMHKSKVLSMIVKEIEKAKSVIIKNNQKQIQKSK
ncbi:MAG: DUF4011 domain-containing protein [Clostridia bacterium]|nr:DUF4011 domain-containing protein [Clostridia bacterium]